MNCIRVETLLSAYLDRELSGEESLMIREHIRMCPSCAQEMEDLRAVKSIAMRMAPVEPSDDLLAKLKANIGAPEPKRHFPARQAVMIGAVAAASAALTLSLLNWASQTSSPQVPIANDQLSGDVYVSGVEMGGGYRPVSLVRSEE
ncbi:MAG: zf-HC2 domain-containing protein [Armatimonadetes bacterium]|nr:zf-HC2 domain-containing protein [Armatimonadota bacterium]